MRPDTNDMEEEKLHLLPSETATPQKYQRLMHYRRERPPYMTITICLVTLAVTVFNLYMAIRKPFCSRNTFHNVLFEENAEFQNLSRSYNENWDKLVTPNGGFFSEITKDGETTAHGLSMFHQLHCLSMIRTALQDVALPPPATSKKDEKGELAAKGHHKGHLDMLHVRHCLDYVRQSILCQADETPEPAVIERDGKRTVSGMIWRQCRDSGALYKKSLKAGDSPWKKPATGSSTRLQAHE